MSADGVENNTDELVSILWMALAHLEDSRAHLEGLNVR